jgi:hypothetical protein
MSMCIWRDGLFFLLCYVVRLFQKYGTRNTMYCSELEMLALDINIVAVLVTLDGVWIGNEIYCSFKQNFATHCHSQTCVRSHCDAWQHLPRVDIPLLPGSYPCRLTAIKHQPTLPTEDTADCSLLYSLGKDCTENTSSNHSYIVACTFVDAITWWLPSHCLAMGMFAEPFTSNDVSAGFTVMAFSRHATICTSFWQK